MIRNYFLIAIRSLWRNRLIASFNLLGMALGFGIFLSLLSMARFELEFDRFHEDIENMYILFVNLNMDGSEYTSERTGGIYASELRENFPQVLSSCRISEPLNFDLGVRGEPDSLAPLKIIEEDHVLAVDSTFMDFFSFRLVEGDAEHIFTSRDHLVLTRSTARALFGEESPLGKVVQVGEAGNFQVAGMVEDPPEVSTYQFGALVGFHVLAVRGYPLEGHGGTMYYNNFKLDPATDLTVLNGAIQNHIQEHFDLDLDARYYLDRFSRVHLHGETRSIQSVYMALIMAVIILLIAIINFINLSTAYASKRAGEIAIRKSAGAGKGQLVRQFLGETYLLLFLAMYLGFFLAELLLPRLSGSLQTNISLQYSSPDFWLQVILVFLVTGLLAGLYPAVKIAGFRPPHFLGNRFRGERRGRSVSRRVLIVAQFTFSILFIIVAVLMMQQMEYMKKADLGFNREEVLYTSTKGQIWNTFGRVKQELESLPYVRGVSSASEVPVMINSGEIGWGEENGDHNQIAVVLHCDEDFLSVFDIDMQEGRFFYRGADSLNRNYVVVNRALVDLLGWEDPVGRRFWLWEQHFTVLGVVENIDFFPFNLEIFNNKAMIMRYDRVRPYIFIRTAGVLSVEERSGIEEIFLRNNPGYAFESEYVSDYRFEAQEGIESLRFIAWVFSVVAVLIAVMGIIGLSVFNNERRTRELGIRKAMGATDNGVLRLLLREFLTLVLISNATGMAAAWFTARRLLQIFAYSIDPGAGLFVLVLLVSLLISLGTVAVLGYRTARANPVDSLRYE